MIRVIVVDDSAVVRQIFERALARDPEIEVVATAPDPFVARDLIVAHQPDVLTLDIEMPRMDGVDFLRRLMHFKPMPVVIVSSLSQAGSAVALEALRAGAVEVLAKPGPAYSAAELSDDLVRAVKAAARAHPSKAGAAPERGPAGALSRTTNRVLAIGASTGGTVALEQLFSALPHDIPGTVVAQHMPEVFTRLFAARLKEATGLDVREAVDGDSLTPGCVLIAPGNKHLLVNRSGARYFAQVRDGPRVNHHRPSVDVLFRSVARAAGANAVGVILTGMGGDGAKGMLEMHEAGAHTLAQDEASCVVFGMPRVAIELGAVDEIVSLDQMPHRIVDALHFENQPAPAHPGRLGGVPDARQ
ncbi:MAG: chemotaxis response regulator protein-glutamate methylesterase [Myxococcales bacterium]